MTVQKTEWIGNAGVTSVLSLADVVVVEDLMEMKLGKSFRRQALNRPQTVTGNPNRGNAIIPPPDPHSIKAFSWSFAVSAFFHSSACNSAASLGVQWSIKIGAVPCGSF